MTVRSVDVRLTADVRQYMASFTAAGAASQRLALQAERASAQQQRAIEAQARAVQNLARVQAQAAVEAAAAQRLVAAALQEEARARARGDAAAAASARAQVAAARAQVGAVTAASRSAEAQARAQVTQARQAATAAAQQTQQAKSATAATSGMSLAMKAGAGAALALGAGLVYAVRESAEFDKWMRNVNSLLHVSEPQFRALESAVIDMSTALPQSATTLAQGLYDITSSGFAGAKAMQVLRTSAEAASAGLSTTATSSRAITAVLNAYGLQASDAKDVSDTLFQTVNLGVVSFDELASQLGDVVGAAAAAHVPIADVGSAIAAMTLAGISGAEATTSLNQMLTKIIAPSDALTKALKDLGYQSGEQALKTRGLYGLMNDLAKSTGGSVTAWRNLFPEIRAARGAFALTAASGENYRRTQEGIANGANRAGATQKALAEQSKALTYQWSLLKNEANAVALRVGTALIPYLVKGAEAAQGFLKGLQGAGSMARDLAPFGVALANIGRLIMALGEDVAPVARDLGTLGGGAAVGALHALGVALQDVTGFLADHEQVVLALAVAYSVNLVRGSLAAGGALNRLALGALTRYTVAVMDARTATAGLGARIGGLAAAAAGPAVLTAALYTGIEAWAGYRRGVTQAQDVLRNTDKALRTGTLGALQQQVAQLQGVRDSYDALGRQFDQANPLSKFFDVSRSAQLIALHSKMGDVEKDLARVQTQALLMDDSLRRYLQETIGRNAFLALQDSGKLQGKLKDLSDEAQAAGVTTSDSFDQMRTKMANYAKETSPTRIATQQLQQAFSDTSGSAEDLKKGVDDLTNALDTLIGVNLNADAAAAKLQGDLDDMAHKFDAARKKGDSFTTSLSLNTKGGRDNRAMVRGLVSDIVDKVTADAKAGKSTRTLTGDIENGRKGLLKATDAAGLNRAAVKKLIDQYGLTPALVQTIIATVGIPKAKSELQSFDEQVQRLKNKRVTVTAQMEWDALAKGGVNQGAASGGTKGQTLRAQGGYIAGPGGPTDDRIPAWLSNGEYVLRASAVNALGTDFLDSLNRYASGGLVARDVTVQASAPGGRVAAAQMRVDYAAIIKATGVQAAQAAAREVGKGISGALNFARGEVGKPYIWGGVGPAGYDCSGFMSAIANYILGSPIHQRRFATASFAGGNGAGGMVPGYGRPGGFSIGVMQGNPGHTAGTLAGVNVESRGGQGVVVGPSARGASNSLFSQHFHLKGYAQGGAVGDAAFDYLDPRGKRHAQYLALLSNGEYVINPRSAARIGYGNLDMLNRYAGGGLVRRKYATGGRVTTTNPRRGTAEDDMPARSPGGGRLTAYAHGVGTYSDGYTYSARGWTKPAWRALPGNVPALPPANASPAAVDRTIAAMDAYVKRWQEANRAADEHAARLEHVHTLSQANADVAKAEAEVRKAARTKDKSDDQQARSDLAQARAARAQARSDLAAFDAQSRRDARQRALDARQEQLQRQRDAAQRRADAAAAQAQARLDRTNQLSGVDYTARQLPTPAPSISAVLLNARDAVAQIIEWSRDLATLRKRGLSNTAIAALKLEDGPQMLGLERQLLRGTDAEIRQLSSLIWRQRVLAGQSAAGHRLADGGWVSGPGGPRDDRVPAMLSAGEFVVNAAAAARFGAQLERINRPKFADGGRVSAAQSFSPRIDVAVQGGDNWDVVRELRRTREAIVQQTATLARQSTVVAVAGGVV